MSKKKVAIRVESCFTFEYDPESKDFKDSLKSYNEAICKGDEYALLKQIAHHFLTGRSINEIVEGVGLVALKNAKHRHHKNLFSGVTVENDKPGFEMEIA